MNNSNSKQHYDRHAYNSGMAAFFLGGICAISAGIIVSILRDHYQFNFSLSGTLVSTMSIGNMIALLISGILPGRIGERATTLILSAGAFIGYLMTALTGNTAILLLAFLLMGISKGCTANKCTLLVGSNTDDRPKAMSLMNAWFALGALMCPFLITALQGISPSLPMIGVSLAGLCLWFVFFFSGLPGKGTTDTGAAGKTDYTFLRNPVFWILAMLLFCQNAAEYTVNGWVVTYYKNEQILSGTLATYTVTVQWIFTLTARLMLAFALKIKKPFRALMIMGIGMIITYGLMLTVNAPVPALVMLALFSFSVAGVYPMGVASIGEMLSSASLGFLLSIAGIGGILFPWLVGIIADFAGLRVGMGVNLIPCAGIIILSGIMCHRQTKA
ncbi:MAG: MFS transporter [Clostridia bacterium]|nr:MFS transporter [Clostridia bacterium]